MQSSLSLHADPLCRHIIYERVEGEACTDMTGGISDGGPSLDDMKAFIEDYAAVSIKLSDIPCEAIGSFTTDSDGIIKVGPPISRIYRRIWKLHSSMGRSTPFETVT